MSTQAASTAALVDSLSVRFDLDDTAEQELQAVATVCVFFSLRGYTSQFPQFSRGLLKTTPSQLRTL